MTGHTPVLMTEAVTALALQPERHYVDATFGRGGYSAAMLAAAACTVTAFDRDPDAVPAAAALAGRFAHRFAFVPACFSLMAQHVPAAAGIVFDLGVSSPQLDDAARGFSFRFDGPLDMRMSQTGPTAADFINTAREEDLANVFYHLGEERHARRVARRIVAARAEQPFTRTAELAAVVRTAVPQSRDGIDPATRTFQAIRLHINQELEELEAGLRAAEKILEPGGRLAVVSFHSLEDRMVKTFLKERSGGDSPSRHAPPPPGCTPTFTLLTRRAVKPGEAEIRLNPRARSARLRVAEKKPVFKPEEPCRA